MQTDDCDFQCNHRHGAAGLLAIALLAGHALYAAGTLPVPVNGIYLGFRADPNLANNQEGAIEVREGASSSGINRTFALHLSYYAWTDLANELTGSGVFTPDSTLSGDISHGRIPVISWKCDSAVANSDHVIAGGDPSEDAVITATAKALAQYPGPVFLRWMWEFNDVANHQSCLGYTNGIPAPQVYSDFIAAWKHIWSLFQSAGATNVMFLWNAAYYAADGAADDPHSFYPGNSYVDWIGLDTYQRSETETFDEDFGLFYRDFSQSQFGNKPLMVGENGSQDFAQFNTELQWTYIQGLLSDVHANRYPLLKAYDYFDAGTPVTWVLDDNNGQGNGGLAAFAILGASPSFSPVAITRVANAEGEAPVIAPNTWVEIKGVGLAPAGDSRTWQSSDLVNSQMPPRLDGVSATVNGKSAYVSYISSTQVNILTPPDAMTEPANVVLTNNGTTTAAFSVQAQPLSPSFFVFNGGPYVAAVHADGTYLGPAGLYRGSRPAGPGEIVLLYANGFGPTSTPVVSGSLVQGGTLSTLPAVMIGGIAADVQYAGLVGPGEFQFNVVVPANVAGGDQPVVATYNGSATQPGTLITIQH